MSNHLISLDQNIAYKKTLEYLKKYQSEPIGFTDYLGGTASDKVYPKQNNTSIALLIQIYEKLEYLEGKLRIFEEKIDSKLKKIEEKLNFNKELEKITQQFSQIPVDKKKQPLLEKEKYKFPYKNESEKVVFWSK